jgi:hypothetical protein
VRQRRRLDGSTFLALAVPVGDLGCEMEIYNYIGNW